MKRIISLLFVCLLCVTLTVPCFAEEFVNPPIVDGAQYLNEAQLEKLSEKIEGIRQKYNFEVAIVTEDEMSGYDAMSSADDIYDYNGYGAGENDDGILLYICAETREYWITTHADGLRVFNERGIDYLKKNIEEQLVNDNYYLAMDVFADLCDELLEMAANGVRITWDEAKPGDLAVYSDNSHIGIVAGRKDNGNLLVIHCNAGANNVVITDEEGFGWAVKVMD